MRDVGTAVSGKDIATMDQIPILGINLYTMSTTSNVNAVANMWYRTTATSTGMFILPSGADNGDQIIIENLSASTVSINYAGTTNNTIEGSTGAFSLGIGEFVELTYYSGNTTWYQRRYLFNPTAGTTVRRDGNGRAQFADPVSAQDAVTLNYLSGANRRVKPNNGFTFTTAESIVMQMAIPANSLAVNDVLRFSYSVVPNASAGFTTKLRIGTAGTVSDATNQTMSIPSGGSNIPTLVTGLITITAIGTTASFYGTAQTICASAYTGATAPSGTFNSTIANYFSITSQATVGTSTSNIVRGGYLERI